MSVMFEQRLAAAEEELARTRDDHAECAASLKRLEQRLDDMDREQADRLEEIEDKVDELPAKFADAVLENRRARHKCIHMAAKAIIEDKWVRRGFVVILMLVVGGSLFGVFDISIGNGWFTARGSN